MIYGLELISCLDYLITLYFGTPQKKNENDCISNTLKLLQVKIAEADKKLERVRKAYEDGVDTIEEYKTNKEKIINEADKLKDMLSEEQNKIKEDNAPKLSDSKTAKVKRDIKKISDILKSSK